MGDREDALVAVLRSAKKAVMIYRRSAKGQLIVDAMGQNCMQLQDFLVKKGFEMIHERAELIKYESGELSVFRSFF